ncbi:hypothetical protein [Parvibacter caecicola]|uniref:hypothetical protein n=1 Tax=Parvibacter caecicola TaxID=747645 RepID=UPI00249C44FF|nr:hypothetical protein [Parvibacter caecicola]
MITFSFKQLRQVRSGCNSVAGRLACAVALVAVAMAAGCSSPEVPEAQPATEQGQPMSRDGAAPEEHVGETSRAMVIAVGEQVLLVNTETQAPYYPAIPEGGLTDVEGRPISPDQLAVGNVVEVTGNGIMLESYPGQYPGVTAIRVVEQGKPEDAQKYQALIDELAASGATEGAVPFASAAYRTETADASLLLEPAGYTWEMPDGTMDSQELNLTEADGSVTTSLNDARISDKTDVTVMFDVPAQGVAVTRMPLAATASGHAVDATVTEEAVECLLSGSDAAFSIQPDSLYVVSANFEAGQVIYAFVALPPRS